MEYKEKDREAGTADSMWYERRLIMSSHICWRAHLVWSTAYREPMIQPEWETRLWGYLGKLLESRKGQLLAANGMPDHIHLYTILPSTSALAALVNALKANSSRWIHETFKEQQFAWQSGYGAFSVSISRDAEVREYVLNQKMHHRQQSYQEEYLAFLKRHEIAYDPRYVFE